MVQKIDLQFLKKVRIIGIIEGISTILLFGVAMPLKYFASMPLAVRIVGSIHGFLFLALVLTFLIAIKKVPLGARLGFCGILAAIFPFGPFIVDIQLKKIALLELKL